MQRAPLHALMRLFVASACLALVFPVAGSQAEDPPRKLRVGTFDDPPFSMKDVSGHWTGLAVELWRSVARSMGVEYELTAYDVPQDMFEQLQNGELDVVAGAVPITLEQVKVMEYSSPFLTKGYAIATTPSTETSWIRTLDAGLSRRLRDVLYVTLAVFVGAALGIWVIERRRNPNHFGGSATNGIANALWWSATTMTTVGYGDRTPVTPAGRFFAMFVMFLSLVLVSLATGLIASRFTIVDLEARVKGLSDLTHVRVGVMRSSPMVAFLDERAIPYSRFDTIERAVDTLVAGGLDAVLGGEAELNYIADTRHEGQIALVPGVIDQGFVAFALPPQSTLRRQLNAALAGVLESDEWTRMRHVYLHR